MAKSEAAYRDFDHFEIAAAIAEKVTDTAAQRSPGPPCPESDLTEVLSGIADWMAGPGV